MLLQLSRGLDPGPVEQELLCGKEMGVDDIAADVVVEAPLRALKTAFAAFHQVRLRELHQHALNLLIRQRPVVLFGDQSDKITIQHSF
jgi:hypothetical protein